MPSFIKFILFSIFSLLFGLFLSGLNKKRFINQDVIQIALLGTLSIFGLMFFIGALLIAFGIQLGVKFATGLYFSLLFLLIIRLITLFSSSLSGFSQFFSVVGILLFSLYVLYDTNNILQRNYSGDFITASLDYYLDIINIFVNLINYNNN
jgi:FtsH-binding integral membrane protein